VNASNRKLSDTLDTLDIDLQKRMSELAPIGEELPGRPDGVRGVQTRRGPGRPRKDPNRVKQTTEYAYKWKDKQDATTCPDHIHGTIGGYVNYGCRLDCCSTAWRDYRRGYNARKKEQLR
jgi:hypothetical protein